jgi:Zn-dependent protease
VVEPWKGTFCALLRGVVRNRGVVWRGGLRLGRWHRIELNLHLGFVVTLGLVTYVLAMAFLPRVFPGWDRATYWLVATTITVTDSLAGLLHELGHAAAALGRGRRVYRITLYGVAAAATRCGGPVRPRDQFAISLAGPLSHLLVASALLCTWTLLPIDNGPLRVATGFSALSNYAVGVLNLVPIEPLDGGRVARALVGGIFRG